MKDFRASARFARGLAACWLALAGLLLSGCPGQQAGSTLSRGDELLKKMQSVYQQAQSYSDVAELKAEIVVDGQVVALENANVSVAYEKTNLLRIEAFDASVVCDGQHLWAAINEQPLAGQVLFLPAPTEMTMKVLYQEPILEKILGGDESRVRMPQLELLLANQPLQHIFGDNLTTRWLGEKMLSGEKTLCHQVEVTGSRGTFVLWVDPNSYLLRRLEITDQKFLEVDLEENQKYVITIDFTGAEFERKIAENAFKFEPPASAKLVTRFVISPREPNELLGQKPDDLKFVDLDGQPVSLASLQGRVVVLDMWAVSCEDCFKGFPNLEKVYRQYRDNDKVVILTVNNDPAAVSDAKLREAFAKAKLDLLIVRDPEGLSQSVFKIPIWPAMIILGPDGKVQDYELGYKADLAETLPAKIDELLAGKDFAEEILTKYQRELANYQRQLAEATVGVNQQIELPRAKIAEATRPKQLNIEKLWATTDVKNPGNLLTFSNAEGQPTIAMLDGWRTVCQIDGSGKTVARRELDLPEGEVLTQLRTGVDGQGQRFFAAFGALQHKVYLLDQDWKILGSYPEETRQGISDVQLADLDGDGELEALVGYLGEVGVQAASLSGKRLYSNRSFENVLSMAVLPRDPDGHRRVLIGNERPAIGVLDYQLTQLADIPVAGRPIDVIVAANLATADTASDESPDRAAWKLAALSATGPAELVALGLDAHGQVVWEYPLPAGARNTPCDVLVPGRLKIGGSGQWLLTGVDGSIRILAANGQTIDSFNYGEEMTGIGTIEVETQSLLLVATAHELAAWKVTAGDTPAEAAPADEPALETADRPDRPALGGVPDLNTDPDEASGSAGEDSPEKPAE